MPVVSLNRSESVTSIQVAYASVSYNTEALASLITQAVYDVVGETDLNSDIYSLRIHNGNSDEADTTASMDLAFLGTYTWDMGGTPEEFEAFSSDLASRFTRKLDDNRRFPSIAVFGTGETQWGEENYCKAADDAADLFNSPYPVLKLEHRPLESDYPRIKEWVREVITKFSGQEV